MSVDLSKLNNEPRVLIEAHLRPVAGTRFQPTGFPDLGAATYEGPDGTPMLLVESAQSVANRLEAVCWDEATDDLVPELKGLPYVRVRLRGIGSGKDTTSSLQEFHRLNSPYIMSGTLDNGTSFHDLLQTELELGTAKKEGGAEGDGDDVAGVVNLRRLARVAFKYDPNSLVHGFFLEKIAGRLRHPRALSGFIEASGVGRADSGGVKFDRALPKPTVAGLVAKEGYGNVPFARAEFTAKAITAYFNLDLPQIRGYGLGDDATALLTVLSLWKVRRFLDRGLRLRTACDLELVEGEKSLVVKRPNGFTLPQADDMKRQLADLIAKCKGLFADPPVSEITWAGGKKKADKEPKPTAAGKKGRK